MSIFTDYAAKMRQQQTPFNGGLQTYLQGQDKVRQASPLFNTGKMAGIGQQPGVVPPAADTTPVIDSSNAMASLAEMMGPTPAEREAVERRMMRNRAQMTAWTGFFDGLRQLGNLYYASKGATPQKFDNPYGQVDQNIQQQRQLWNDMANYRRNYATSLYNIRRQMQDAARRDKLADAQAQYYDTRGELARLRGENDRMKAEQQVATQKARQAQIEAKTKQMAELHPLQKRKLEAVIKNTLHNASRPYSTGRGGVGRGSGSYDPFTDLAEQLNDNPDVIGPILQQEGLGFYDEKTKEFSFYKNATKGMATTAVRRATGQRKENSSTPQRQSTTTRSGATNNSGFFNK